MKKIFQLLIVLFVLTSCNKTTNTKQYTPKYSKDWGKVETRILETWNHSKIDSSTWQMPGSLNLPLEYFSIHTGRNVLFGWDTYFTNVGLLLVDSFKVYAKNAVENQFEEIEQIGFVPNASEPWGVNRSQVPYLSMMVREVYESHGLVDKTWLKNAYQMLKKDYLFWTDTTQTAIENHQTSIVGLQRYSNNATTEELLKFYEEIKHRFELPKTISEKEKNKFAVAWMSESESGMDFTPRFENRCDEFIPVCLNSNLYIYENNFAWIAAELKLNDEPNWEAKAENRKSLLTQYCWDDEQGLFMDYDFINKRFSKATSITSFYALWAGLATEDQAKRVVENLSLFEHDFGPTICESTIQKNKYQWDFPSGWPPIYYLVTKALDNYGYKKEAKRIAEKYLDIVTKNFLDPKPKFIKLKENGVVETEEREVGFVYEKYNVTDGTVYDVEYTSRPFHGWSFGVFIWSLDYSKSISMAIQ